jgi:hypothetical protein
VWLSQWFDWHSALALCAQLLVPVMSGTGPARAHGAPSR